MKILRNAEAVSEYNVQKYVYEEKKLVQLDKASTSNLQYTRTGRNKLKFAYSYFIL